MPPSTPADGTDRPATDSPATGEGLEALSFAEALERLEALVERLDDTDAPPALEEALDAYEEGNALARECLRRLDDAELRIERLALDE